MKENLENDSLAREKLQQNLRGRFPQLQIISLRELVEKIAVVSKVRVGNDRTYNNYDEVTPTHTDNYGCLIPHKDGKELGPAYKTLLDSQNLNPGDLLISYRGTKHYSVGRAAKKYTRKTIGNNAAIRIQFKQDEQEELPIMVQSYLNLDYVQEYLQSVATLPQNSKYPRKSLTSKILLELPIPKFEVFESAIYKEQHLYNLEIRDLLHQVCEYSQRIQENLQNTLNKDLELYSQDPFKFKNNIISKKILEGQIAQLKIDLEHLEKPRY